MLHGIGNVPTTVGQLKSAPYGCVLLLLASQAILDATDSAISFPDAEPLDSDAFHSTAVDTWKVTIPAGGGGWYDIGACVQFATNATGIRAAWVALNGSGSTGTSIVQQRIASSGAATQTVLVLHTVYLLAAGDYLSLNVRQTSGGNLDASATGHSPRLWVVRRFFV